MILSFLSTKSVQFVLRTGVVVGATAILAAILPSVLKSSGHHRLAELDSTAWVQQAVAQVNPEVAIRKGMDGWLQGRAKVDEIRSTPMPNLYEVRIGADLVYVDATASYALIDGQMIDLKNNKNLTQARIDDLSRIEFADLPLNLAMKQVNGNGKRVLAVFEDANCIYCKRLRKDLVSLPDATIYTFPLSILAADSETKARKALCAPDPSAAWNALMIQGKMPENDGTCTNALKDIQGLGRRLRITGTPTLFFTNGKRVPGGIPLDQLEKMLRENSV